MALVKLLKKEQTSSAENFSAGEKKAIKKLHSKPLRKLPNNLTNKKNFPAQSVSAGETRKLKKLQRKEIVSDEMLDNFFILQGTYQKDVAPSYLSKVTNKEYFIGGFNPESEETEHRYHLVDRNTFRTLVSVDGLETFLSRVSVFLKKMTAEKYRKFKVGKLKNYDLRCRHSDVIFTGECSKLDRERKEILYNFYGEYFNLRDLLKDRDLI